MFLQAFAPACQRALLLTALPALQMTAGVSFAAPTQPEADVQLNTDINRMSMQVEQGAPFPPGGCRAGYAWHTSYGGCRRPETITETASCPAGHTGSRTRQRTVYILQADANNVAHGPWGAWQDTCQRPRLRGVVDELIAMVRGNGYAPTPVGERLSKNLIKQMRVTGGYDSKFALTIDRSSAKLRCVYSRSTSSGNGESGQPDYWDGVIVPPGESVDADYVGRCLLSEGGAVANLYGNCNSLGGSDNYCQWAALTVRIIDTSACMVTTQTERGTSSGRKVIKHYSLCE